LKHARVRRWEIDCLRGLAVLLMLISNFLFDLVYFAGLTWLQSPAMDLFARLVAGTFIFLAGVSLTLSQARPVPDGKGTVPPPRGKGLAKVLRRGLTLMGLGCVVTGATWFAAGDQLVIFGVLHLIGAGLILAYPLLGRPRQSLTLGCVVWALVLFTSGVELDHPWFLWLGLKTPGFSSVDYAPLIPWFGPMLIGLSLGEWLYPGGQPRWPLPDLSRPWPLAALAWSGRHSLIIYFVHQPLLLAGLALTRRWW
jgi:uncharacterized membrane protein